MIGELETFGTEQWKRRMRISEAGMKWQSDLSSHSGAIPASIWGQSYERKRKIQRKRKTKGYLPRMEQSTTTTPAQMSRIAVLGVWVIWTSKEGLPHPWIWTTIIVPAADSSITHRICQPMAGPTCWLLGVP